MLILTVKILVVLTNSNSPLSFMHITSSDPSRKWLKAKMVFFLWTQNILNLLRNPISGVFIFMVTLSRLWGEFFFSKISTSFLDINMLSLFILPIQGENWGGCWPARAGYKFHWSWREGYWKIYSSKGMPKIVSTWLVRLFKFYDGHMYIFMDVCFDTK